MRDDAPDTSNEAIGRRLAEVREARGLHASALARMMEMSPQRWGSYERGRTIPPPQVLARFWQLTGATSDYVLFGSMTGMPMELVGLLRQRAAEEETRSRKPAAG